MRTPFAWGAFDCCTAPGLITQAIAEVDLCAPFRPYDSAAGAVQAMQRYLGTSRPMFGELLGQVAVARAEELRLAEVSVKRAQRGDIALAVAADPARRIDQVLAVVDLSGYGLVTAHADGGWLRLPLATARRVWRV